MPKVLFFSGEQVYNPTRSTGSRKNNGFVAAITNTIGSIFSHGNENNHLYGYEQPPSRPAIPSRDDEEKETNGFLEWLCGGGSRNAGQDWWDCNKDDSYKKWKRYFCY